MTLPHPRAWQRAFVLAPWLALDPAARLAGPHGGEIADLLHEAGDREDVHRIDDSWMTGMADDAPVQPSGSAADINSMEPSTVRRGNRATAIPLPLNRPYTRPSSRWTAAVTRPKPCSARRLSHWRAFPVIRSRASRRCIM